MALIVRESSNTQSKCFGISNFDPYGYNGQPYQTVAGRRQIRKQD